MKLYRLYSRGRSLRVTSLLGVTSLVCVALVLLLTRRTEFKRNGSASAKPNLLLEAKGYPAPIKDNSGIPRIIHQTWRSNEIPEIYLPWITSWRELNPDWQYWFWTDADIEAFIVSNYPQFFDLYKSYPGKGYKADAFRYLVLFEFGGVYVDLDTEALIPLESYVANKDCFVSQEPHAHAYFLSPLGVPLVSNAILGCRPEHPFFRIVLENLHSRAGYFSWNDVLRATGPYMLTEIYRTYAASSEFREEFSRYAVTLADPDTFQPSLDASMVDYMRALCVQSDDDFHLKRDPSQHETLCKQAIGYNFRGSPAEYSYANHHWTHSWAGPRNDPYGVHNSIRKFDITRKLS